MKILSCRDYHLTELDIARSLDDPLHAMPVILPKHQCILDVGCGAGQTLIASDLRSGVIAYGIDINLDALALGRDLTRAIHFVNACGEYLPFRDCTFDLVVARVSLPYTDIPKTICEVRRALKPGGDVWFVLHPTSMVIKKLISSLRHLKIKRALGNLYVLGNGILFHFSGKLFSLPIDKRYESYQTNRSITRVLRAFNFGNIKISRQKHFIVTATKMGANK
jgi:ubiquinone/menaquinone biosynthesis C-methylase UbiE